jgi:tRNA modification GTPase
MKRKAARSKSLPEHPSPFVPHGNTEETIAAISTATGEGGIGIVRISGPEAIAVADRITRAPSLASLRAAPSHTIHYGKIVDPVTGEMLDEVFVTILREPRTYTREDIVEINAHGGPVLLQRILELVLRQGARQADPGEFTKRAFLNGRIDLTQAEAVMDLIRARTESSGRAALRRLEGALGREIQELGERLKTALAMIEAAMDFPEEEIETPARDRTLQEIEWIRSRMTELLDTAEEGRILREGLTTVIVGRTNVGKSSLLNQLLKQNRAIVSPAPGTTRDILEESLNIHGVPVRIIDTAGLRSSTDPIELEGMRRTMAAIAAADLLLVVVDASAGLVSEEEILLNENRSEKKIILAINKRDLAPQAAQILESRMAPKVPTVTISATEGQGLDQLKEKVKTVVLATAGRGAERVLIAQARHRTALSHAQEGLRRAVESLKDGRPEEIVAVDLRLAMDRLGEIVGTTTTDDILDQIFRTFCIGK